MSNTLKILVHVLSWALYILIDLVLWSLPYYTEGEGHLRSFTILVSLCYIVKAGFFYFNYYFIVPRFLITKRFPSYIFWISVAIATELIGLGFLWNNYKFIPGLFLQSQVGGIIFTCFYFLVISTGLSMFYYWKESQKKRLDLEKEVLESELLFLKSQMSPHFLFNTFNNIYGLALKNKPQTADAILQLKDMLLYFEHFEKGDKISLEKEVLYLQSFIDLNKLRFSIPVTFETQILEVHRDIKVEPMLFLPFIENAFKHGNAGNISKPIIISLYAIDTQIIFSVSNEIMTNKRKDHVGGIGISNVKRRLELLYSKQYFLNISQDTEVFKIDLTLFIS